MKTLIEHNKDVIEALVPGTPSSAGVLCPVCGTEMVISTLSSLNNDSTAIENGDVAFIPVCDPVATPVECPNGDYAGFKL